MLLPIYSRKPTTYSHPLQEQTITIFLDLYWKIPYLSIFSWPKQCIPIQQRENEYETIAYERNNQILAASIDSLGTLWIAEPNGVTRIHLPSNRKEPLKLPDGNDVITSLVIDHEGIVWMGSLGIIYAYNPHKNHFVIYNEMDGILPNDFLAKPALVASDGNIYMGGSEDWYESTKL